VLDWNKVNPFRRSICVDYLYDNADGTIREIFPTREGVDAAEQRMKCWEGISLKVPLQAALEKPSQLEKNQASMFQDPLCLKGRKVMKSAWWTMKASVLLFTMLPSPAWAAMMWQTSAGIPQLSARETPEKGWRRYLP